MSYDAGTWTCHICGRERPDAQISVQRNFTADPVLGQVQENVRYCNDEANCATLAKTFSFLRRPDAPAETIGDR